jgi:cytochrome c
MKKLIATATVLAIILVAACGGAETNESGKRDAAADIPKTEDVTQSAVYKAGVKLVAQNGCLTCHKISEASTGPSYKEIANRYLGATDTTIARIASHIQKGGSGLWGQIPMTPHPDLSDEDARTMVNYVLLLK